MIPDFKKALITGVERVAAWSDVLDDINVFPVADGDTGRNLIASLTPLRYLEENREDTTYSLLVSARGNSGNIAAQFFSGVLGADSYATLFQAVLSGREKAFKAVSQPVDGTMLSVLDDLVDFLSSHDFEGSVEYVDRIMDVLEASVRMTPERLPLLKKAGVVDSGALGMFIFLEGFFRRLIGQHNGFRPIGTIFEGLLEIEPSYQTKEEQGFCIDTVIRHDPVRGTALENFSRQGESVVVIPHKNVVKVHLHTDNFLEARAQMESLGEVVHWEDDDLGSQVREFRRRQPEGAVHIMTDAAGSVTRDNARELGITLLDSYIIAGQKSLPETLFSPDELYDTMLAGTRVSTSQASVFERHEYYQRVTNQYDRVLYICVGSVFTGNYDVAMEWKARNDHDDRLTIIDSGAASGRLGAIVLATAKFAAHTHDVQAVVDYAHNAAATSREFIFLDRLKYLAAGGRMPKAKAVFGELLRVKPIVSPTSQGVVKVGTAKNRKGQLKFALEQFEAAFDAKDTPFVMLEYSNNRTWVDAVVRKEIVARCPHAEIIPQPLSLTSAVHMGPGTWAMAYIPS